MLDVLAGGLIGAFAGFVWSWNKARLARDRGDMQASADPPLRNRIAAALIAATVGGLIGAALGGMIGPRRTD